MAGEAKLFRFGTFEADLRTGELRKAGRKVGIQEQPFKVLAALLARPGEMVAREELKEQLWSADTFVDFDMGLNRAVAKIRDILSDSPTSPRFIETLPRRGYRFLGAVEAVYPEAAVASPPEKSNIQAVVPEFASAGVPEPAVPRRRRWLLLAIAAAIVLAAVGGWLWRNRSRSRPEFGSIAVLPLENLSGDPSQDFFADGITDELITELAEIGSLRVISRTSVMHYRGSRKPLPEIARELGVDAIVEGSVVRAGDRVRVTAQLIDAATDHHLWARSYEQGWGDVLALQGRVAQDIAAQVNAKLTDEESRNLAHPKAVGLEAHENYLKGHLLLHDSPEESVRYFERAIELDPQYPEAYAGLAEACLWPAWDWGTVAPAAAFPKGKAAALKALQIAPASSEGHAALAWVELFYEWNWRDAESEMRQAIRLNPNNAWEHHHYSRLLAVTGRFDESIRESRRMLELDPMDFRSGGNLAWMMYLARRYDESIQEIRRLIPLHPSIVAFHCFLAWPYEAQGRFPEALNELGVFERTGLAAGLGELGFSYGASGNEPAARRALAQLLSMSKRVYVPPYYVALVSVGLHDYDGAFGWLEKAYQERSPFLVYLKTEPKLDPPRYDGRFTDLVRRVGFP